MDLTPTGCNEVVLARPSNRRPRKPAVGPSEDGLMLQHGVRLRLQDQRWGVIACVSAAAVLSWIALWVQSRLGHGPGHGAPATQAVMNLGMWAAMLGGMMLPVALPTVLQLHGRRPGGFARKGAFVFSIRLLAGWLVVWSAFAAGAAALQLCLHQAGWLDGPMGRVDPRLGAMLWVTAGGWQMTRWKRRCLRRCDFSGRSRQLTTGAKAGDAFGKGLLFGVGCVGSCWALMLLMFVGGVMNLWWMAGLTLFLLVERLVAKPLLLIRVAGIVLMLTGFAWVPGSEQRETIEWCKPPPEPGHERREAGSPLVFLAWLQADMKAGSA